jgi:opacity protein-like surface antigen
MKTKLFLLLLIFPALTYAQVKRSGLSIGVNIGTWNGDTELFANSFENEMNNVNGFSDFNFESTSRIGFCLNLFTEIPINETFLIQPELGYTQRGMEFSGDGSYGTYNVSTDIIYKWDYVDLALLFKYRFLTDGFIKPYLFVGPGAGYVISSKLKVLASVDGETDSESEDFETDQKFDANLNLGAGFDFSEKMRLEMRYSVGFMSILDEDPTDDSKYTNRGLCICLGCYF